MALIVGGCLAAVSFAERRGQPRGPRERWCAGRRPRCGERKIALAREIANLTPQEREILAYLVTRNEQVFMGTHHPQKAGGSVALLQRPFPLNASCLKALLLV